MSAKTVAFGVRLAKGEEDCENDDTNFDIAGRREDEYLVASEQWTRVPLGLGTGPGPGTNEEDRDRTRSTRTPNG